MAKAARHGAAKRGSGARRAAPGERPAPAPASAAAIRRSLLSWFDRHRRPLPWRVCPVDPYHVWVSEIMLQQTQVATMLPYWRRFIDSFPTVASLAQARIDDVLAHWAGLGYYRRAHHLHAAARRIVAEHGGQVPGDAATLRTLPGVGRYTAGAVASIAFGRREAVLDGNVARVLSRVFHRSAIGPRDANGANGRPGGPTGGGERPHSAAGEEALNGDARTRTAALWRLAESLLPAKRPGDFNQALMELGALVCLPQSPKCAACPIARHCAARAGGAQQAALPAARRTTRATMEVVSLVIRRRGRVLLERRSDGGLWSGMWELPSAAIESGANAEQAARRVLKRVGLRASALSPAADVTRVLTHRVYRVRAFVVSSHSGRIRRNGLFQWCDPVTPEVGVIGPSSEVIRRSFALFSVCPSERSGRV